jgi:diguanylate cyclase (GGDEF)-like protein
VSLLVQRRDELRSSGAESRVDNVTGLQTMDVLSRAVDAVIGMTAHGTAEPFDLVYFDIVAFKFYNITYGFDAGDRLLRQMSQAIGSAVGIDRVARYGADNFYALVEGSRSEEAVKTVHAQLAEDATYGALVRAGIYRITGDEASAGQVVDRAKMAGDAAAGDFVRYWRRFEKGMEESLALRSYVVRRGRRSGSAGVDRGLFPADRGYVFRQGGERGSPCPLEGPRTRYAAPRPIHRHARARQARLQGRFGNSAAGLCAHRGSSCAGRGLRARVGELFTLRPAG